MLAIVNGTDITKHINSKSYKMNSSKNYQSWLDGNYREHRIYTRSKIQGSFTVILYGQDDILTQDFIDNWNGAVDNDVVTITLYVQNTNKMETIEAYFEFDGSFHREMINGEYCDKLSIKIEEV